jgi:transposase
MDGTRGRMTNEVWERISKALYAVKHPAGSPPELSDRDFVDAILFVARTGIPWRDLPERFGDWNAVYQRFRRWQKAGYWDAIFLIVPGDLADAERLLFDSTIVRAHSHAAGAPQKKGAKRARDLVEAEADSQASCILPPQTNRRLSLSC